MKVIAINGSPKAEGNTFHALNTVLTELNNQGIETEIIHVGNKSIRGCMGCGQCVKNMNEKCALSDDIVNDSIQKLKEADGILLGSPVYYAGVNGTMKSFLDRVFYVAGVNKGLFRHKVGASVAAVRRSGGLPTYHQLNHYINYSEMIMPSANYWNVIHGAKPGEALKDDEGVQIMRVLGKNMAWVLKLVENGKDKVEAPEPERKSWTNFIR